MNRGCNSLPAWLEYDLNSHSGCGASVCSRLRLYYDSYAQNDVIEASCKGNCNWRHRKHHGDGICRNLISIVNTRIYGSCIDRRNILDRIWHNTASRLSCSISCHVLGHEARIAKEADVSTLALTCLIYLFIPTVTFN